jgi:metal-responsive CopG/Arc/MetJ family transcriptional regulator
MYSHRYVMRNSVLVTVTLGRDLLAKIDGKRGLVSRSAFIRQKLEKCV